jgi:single-strand DNA-binding protein
MASVNKVFVLGNLGQDPEVRYAPSGVAIVTISVATSRKWKDKSTGDPVEETEWHRIVAYDKLAEIIGQYLRKGDSVHFEGRLKTRKWEKDGVERYTTEIIAEQMTMLGKREDRAPAERPAAPAARPAPGARPATPPRQTSGTGFDAMDDDIPF